MVTRKVKKSWKLIVPRRRFRGNQFDQSRKKKVVVVMKGGTPNIKLIVGKEVR